jgi:hypothetical protein
MTEDAEGKKHDTELPPGTEQQAAFLKAAGKNVLLSAMLPTISVPWEAGEMKREITKNLGGCLNQLKETGTCVVGGQNTDDFKLSGDRVRVKIDAHHVEMDRWTNGTEPKHAELKLPKETSDMLPSPVQARSQSPIKPASFKP